MKDNEIISMFMQSFHQLTTHRDWSSIRFMTNPEIEATFEIKISELTKQANIASTDHNEFLFKGLASHLRQFMVGEDLTNFETLIPRIQRVIGEDRFLQEVHSSWKQFTDKKYYFFHRGAETVGFRLTEGTDIFWEQYPSGQPIPVDGQIGLSLQDFMDVYFHESWLHPVEVTKMEETRAMVRSVPVSLQNVLRKTAVACIGYAAMNLHMTLCLHWSGSSFICGPTCQENPLVEQQRKESLKRKA